MALLLKGIHRSPVNSPHKWPVTWNMFPFDDVIMFEINKELSSRRQNCGASFGRNTRQAI